MSHEKQAEALAAAVLDMLDVGVFVLTTDLETTLLSNAAGRRLIGEQLPPQLIEQVEAYLVSRRTTGRPPPIRVALGARVFYLRAIRVDHPRVVEVVFVREEMVHDPDLFRLVNARFGVTRREFGVLQRLRHGRTNPQIAAELEIALGTVRFHVQRLLRRFDVKNRTQLVAAVDRLLNRGQ